MALRAIRLQVWESEGDVDVMPGRGLWMQAMSDLVGPERCVLHALQTLQFLNLREGLRTQVALG